MLIRTLRELAAPNIRLFTAYRSENLRRSRRGMPAGQKTGASFN